MLTMNRIAVDRTEKLYERFCDADKDFTKEIAGYVREGGFPLQELDFSFRMGDDKDTTFHAVPGNEKLNTLQNKAKNEKSWRILFVIAELYRSVAQEQGSFSRQETGDAWYYTDLHYNTGTYMVPYVILKLVMDLLKERWDTKEILNIDRKKKKKEAEDAAADEAEAEEAEDEDGEEDPDGSGETDEDEAEDTEEEQD